MRETLSGMALVLTVALPANAEIPDDRMSLLFKRNQVSEVWPLFQELHGDRFPVGEYGQAFLEHAIADLNADGQNEILLRTTEVDACVLSACPTIIAEFDGDDWHEIGLIYSALVEAETVPGEYALLHVYDSYRRRAEPVAYRMDAGRYGLDLATYGEAVTMTPADGSGVTADAVLAILDRSAPEQGLMIRSSTAPGDQFMIGKGDLNHDGQPETFLRIEHASVCAPDIGCPTLVVSDLADGAFASTWSEMGTDLVLVDPVEWDRLTSILVKRPSGPALLSWSPEEGEYQEAPF